MLNHPTHDRLITLGLSGMAKAFEEQRLSPDLEALTFEERIGIMVDREAADRDSKRVAARLKFAALRQAACVEDIDMRTPRGIDRALLARLVAGEWISQHQNCLIIAPAGSAKVGSPVPLATRHVAMAATSSTNASQDCSKLSRWRAAMAVTHAFSKISPERTCLFSTIGGSQS